MDNTSDFSSLLGRLGVDQDFSKRLAQELSQGAEVNAVSSGIVLHLILQKLLGTMSPDSEFPPDYHFLIKRFKGHSYLEEDFYSLVETFLNGLDVSGTT